MTKPNLYVIIFSVSVAAAVYPPRLFILFKGQVRIVEEMIINSIQSKMKDFIDGQKFVADENGVYSNDKISFALKYDEGAGHIILEAGTDENSLVKLAEWLCNEESLKYDADIIAEDFCEALRKHLGLKKSSVNIGGSVTIPVKDKSGSDITVDGLTAKLLNIYPEFKEDYKQSVAGHGEYLYIDFMRNTVVKKLRALADDYEHNFKPIEKILNIAADAFYSGTQEASDLAVGYIVAASFYDKAEAFDECIQGDIIKNKPLFVTAAKVTLAKAAKDKKFASVIG